MRETLATKTAARDQHDLTLAEAATKIEWRKTQQSKIQQQLAELSARINRNDVYATEKKLETRRIPVTRGRRIVAQQ
jgi:hypothetical protein